MGRILVAYASTTGNTELMAEAITDHLLYLGHEAVIKSFDFEPVYVDDVSEYDAIVVGTHTWDDGALPYEIEDFYDDLDDVDISGKIFAVFGSADSFYDSYGGAIDLVGDRVKELGATLLPWRLKVDLEPDQQDILHCQEFAELVHKTLVERHMVKNTIK